MRDKKPSIGCRVALAMVAVVLVVTSAWAATHEKTLHAFNGVRGASPNGWLIFDTAGNLYGTTFAGGYGNGTVFELTPQAGGGWKEQVLHKFNYENGAFPEAGLIFDAAGNLYGTTLAGGTGGCTTGGCGTVFELTPQAGGDWKGKVVKMFSDNGADGDNP
jgi:uncharacterized repeat protein (TIGR03803 family)